MSPLEELFLDALQRWAPDLDIIRQEFRLLDGKYSLDFAIPRLMRAAELDGYTYHEGAGPSKATADKQRERELDRLGWKLSRFSGEEIRDDPGACAREWLALCGIAPLQWPRKPVRKAEREKNLKAAVRRAHRSHAKVCRQMMRDLLAAEYTRDEAVAIIRMLFGANAPV
jgi:hypothetical protein